MRLLLDTHTLLWWFADDERLPATARGAIGSAVDVLVSAASAWEIATKLRIGKLPGAGPLIEQLPQLLDRNGFRPLSVSLAHALRAGTLPGPHRDPFDRMLIAQAQLEAASLVSNEQVFDRYGVQRVW